MRHRAKERVGAKKRRHVKPPTMSAEVLGYKDARVEDTGTGPVAVQSAVVPNPRASLDTTGEHPTFSITRRK